MNGRYGGYSGNEPDPGFWERFEEAQERLKQPWPGKAEERRCLCGGVYVTSKTSVHGKHSWQRCER